MVRARIILVLLECIWNAPAVSLFLPAFVHTGSSGYPLRRVVYRSYVSSLVTGSRFFAGNREAELKPTTFSLLLLFRVFLSFLFFCPLQRFSALSNDCLSYSLMIYIIIIME